MTSWRQQMFTRLSPASPQLFFVYLTFKVQTPTISSFTLSFSAPALKREILGTLCLFEIWPTLRTFGVSEGICLFSEWEFYFLHAQSLTGISIRSIRGTGTKLSWHTEPSGWVNEVNTLLQSNNGTRKCTCALIPVFFIIYLTKWKLSHLWFFFSHELRYTLLWSSIRIKTFQIKLFLFYVCQLTIIINWTISSSFAAW